MPEDRLMTEEEVAAKLRFKGKVSNQVRKVRRLIREGRLTSVVKISAHHSLVHESVVDCLLRSLEGEGYGPDNRIARVVPRHRA